MHALQQNTIYSFKQTGKNQLSFIINDISWYNYYNFILSLRLISFCLFHQHHCRQCGAVVCGPCSNKKLLLPGQGGGKAVRVCLQCYDAASKVKIAPATNDNINSKDQTRNSADSSGDDSSGDEDDSNKEANHDEVRYLSIIWITLGNKN